ncbi:MAG: cob(I)yrinic acid a,c-diamide adenosyltransferase [Planctomycetia bacterium]|nr:cob(I)yrinic acid a,c-diamide adenosyltransferase [Planctomycetia bacterium]
MSDKPTGLIIVLTGEGKGKTTSALGQAMRAAGRGFAVAVIQFIKAQRSGEHHIADMLPGKIEIHLAGRGFVRGTPGPEDIFAATQGLGLARQKMGSGKFGMVILDEVIVAANCGLLPWQDVFDLLAQRPPEVHLILTGRGAPEELIRRADIVTEMKSVKHPFGEGAAAQEGIEF